jgi:hypothetical protein
MKEQARAASIRADPPSQLALQLRPVGDEPVPGQLSFNESEPGRRTPEEPFDMFVRNKIVPLVTRIPAGRKVARMGADR